MKNKISFVIMPFTLAALVLFASGCQKQADPINNSANQNVEQDAPSNPPFSNGPSALPSVNGPISAPPNNSASVVPESVTAKENIRLTLPIQQK